MAETYLITEYKPYDFDEANKHFSENGFPEPDPVVGDRSRTGIVTCSDPRCNPEDYFKLDYKEAFVVRNEGGRAADPGVVRTLVLIAELSAPVGEYIREVKVIHHTGIVQISLLKLVAPV
jgi:carbonic anhydrase